MMDGLDAVIFDMDGVLIDSEPFWQRAQINVFSRVGLDLTPEDTDQTMGVRINEVVKFWFNRHPWDRPDQSDLAEAIVDEVIKLVEDEGKRMPGVDHALTLAKSLGLSIGLATSSSGRLINAVLGSLDLRNEFAVVCSAAEEERGKPHPDVFLTAARRLGVDPAQCLVIEDSAFGVQAGKAAGMRVIAVPAPYQFDLREFDRADLKLRSLSDLSHDAIAQALAS